MFKILYAISGHYGQHAISEISEELTVTPKKQAKMSSSIEEDYEDMWQRVHRMSICSSIKEDYEEMLQWVHGMSIWEDWLFVPANSVKIREDNIFVQEEAIRVLENRSETLRCKICLLNDSDVILIPCLHIVMCTACHISVYSICPICRSVIQGSRVVYIS